MSRRTSLSTIALMLATGCGSAATTSPATSSSTSTSTSTSTSPSPSASPSTSPSASPSSSPYELHEWGVVDVAYGGGVEIAAGAGAPSRPMSVRKPVVYVHLAEGVDAATFGLTVTLGAGSFVEHYPTGMLGSNTLSWPSITAHRAHCATMVDPSADAARDLPARRGSPVGARMSCGTIDGVCEVDELPRYDAPSSACLDVNGQSSGLLFYRGQAPSLALPLDATRAPDGTVTITAREAFDGMPGGVLRVSTGLSGPWPVGRYVISRAAFPANGVSATIPVGTEVITREQGGAELRATLVSLGLTGDEADAFLAGWQTELFGGGAGREAALPHAQDVLLYFLPSPSIDAIAHLDATPPPSVTRRAFLVRIDLGPVSTG